MKPPLGSTHSDLTKLRQILFNLLSNAGKFSHDDNIILRIERMMLYKQEWLRFQIIDHGIGIPAEKQKQLFQPFTQADASTTRKYGGTGLGLAITKKIISLMGGHITLESTPGHGCTFTVLLPAVVSPDKKSFDIQLLEHLKSTTTPLATENETHTILVIDDDEAVREFLHSHLTRSGYQVLTAESGDEGLRLAKTLHPQMITLDVMMPDIDGWDVLSRLKSDHETADIPVIMMSIEAEPEKGFSLGAADYLIKPVNYQQLNQVIRKYMHDGRSTVLVVEDDPVTRDMLSNMLQRNHCRVITADNGRMGLARLEMNSIDLILLDLMMPEINGFEFAMYMQTHDMWRNIPVVVLTAKDLSAEERERLRISAEAIFQKGSYTKTELLAEIQKLLTLTHRVSPSTLTKI
jgi:CheY-like chemotaxis protein/anti-sigma regulatory factor (Ser/Thr protein kinase)